MLKLFQQLVGAVKKNANNDYRCEIYNVLKNVNKNNISVECQFTPPNDYDTKFFCDNNGKIHVLYSQSNENIQDYEYSDTYLFKKENNNIKIAHGHLPYPFNLSSEEQKQKKMLKQNIIQNKANNFKDTSYEDFIANPPYQTFKELYESLQGTDSIKDARTDKIIQEEEIIKKNEDEEKKKLIPKEFVDCFSKPPNVYLKRFISCKKNESGFIFKKFNDSEIDEFLKSRANNLYSKPKIELKFDFPNTNKYVVINYEHDSSKMRTLYTLTFVDYNDEKNGHYLRIEGYYDCNTEKCVLTKDIFYTKGYISQYLPTKVEPPKIEVKKKKNEEKINKELEDKNKKQPPKIEVETPKEKQLTEEEAQKDEEKKEEPNNTYQNNIINNNEFNNITKSPFTKNNNVENNNTFLNWTQTKNNLLKLNNKKHQFKINNKEKITNFLKKQKQTTLSPEIQTNEDFLNKQQTYPTNNIDNNTHLQQQKFNNNKLSTKYKTNKKIIIPQNILSSSKTENDISLRTTNNKEQEPKHEDYEYWLMIILIGILLWILKEIQIKKYRNKLKKQQNNIKNNLYSLNNNNQNSINV